METCTHSSWVCAYLDVDIDRNFAGLGNCQSSDREKETVVCRLQNEVLKKKYG